MQNPLINTQHWTHVDDALPQPDQYIIYHAPNIFDVGPQMWIGQYENGVWFNRSGFFGGGEVTHWMPLPQLPECEGE